MTLLLEILQQPHCTFLTLLVFVVVVIPPVTAVVAGVVLVVALQLLLLVSSAGFGRSGPRSAVGSSAGAAARSTVVVVVVVSFVLPNFLIAALATSGSFSSLLLVFAGPVFVPSARDERGVSRTDRQFAAGTSLAGTD